MSAERVEPTENPPPAPRSELIYTLEARPPLPQAVFAALQHLLAMFVAVITPALLICKGLNLPAEDTRHILSMSLFASGIAYRLKLGAQLDQDYCRFKGRALTLSRRSLWGA